MRKSLVLFLFPGVLVAAAGGWLGYRAWQTHHVREVAESGLSPRPESSRWPKVLIDRVDQLTAEVKNSDHPVKALGDLARVYEVNGNVPEATTALLALRQLEPQNPHWAYYLTDIKLKANDQSGAIELLKETARLAPDYPPALITLGDLLIRQHRFAEARPYFESCQIFAPNDPRVGANLAYLDGVAGNIRSGLQRLDEVVAKQPRFAGGHHLRAEFLSRLGNNDGAEAERRLEKASLPLVFPDPWLDELYDYCYDSYRLQMVAAGLYRAQRYGDAIAYLKRSVELAPGEASFYDTLADGYMTTGRLDEARTTLELGVKNVPDSFVLRIRLAVLLCRNNQFEAALAVIENALQKWPEEPEVLAARGHILLIANRPDEAVPAFKAALARNSGLAEAHYNLGRSFLLLDRVEEARASFQQALQVRPNYVEALVSLASLAMQAGDVAKAETYAPKLLEYAGSNPAAAKAYAEIQHLAANELAGAGKMAEAEQAYRRGIDADPTLPLLHAGLGMVYVSSNRWTEALPELKRFEELSPTDLRAYSLLGRVQRELGQTAEARKTYELGLGVAKLAGSNEAAGEFEQALKGL